MCGSATPWRDAFTVYDPLRQAMFSALSRAAETAKLSAVNRPSQPCPSRASRPFAVALRRGLPPDGVLLRVSVTRQRMSVFTRHGLWRVFKVSTAANGLGNVRGSNCTPSGWHRVAAWVGEGAPLGQVFVSRRPTADVLPPKVWRSAAGDERITTRILRLAGLEPGVNQGPRIDSLARFIYIHGTNQEQRLGTPASHGCIRLANRDVAALFAFAQGRETWCWIGGNAATFLNEHPTSNVQHRSEEQVRHAKPNRAVTPQL